MFIIQSQERRGLIEHQSFLVFLSKEKDRNQLFDTLTLQKCADLDPVVLVLGINFHKHNTKEKRSSTQKQKKR